VKKCPKCGSRNLLLHQQPPGRTTFYDVCRVCVAVWESLPEGERYKRDGELMAFEKPCDNCAFRAGSPESENKVEWKKLLTELRAGGEFFCHKAVPLTTIGEGSRASFEFPQKADGKFDVGNMRLCRGFLNAWAAWVAKDFPDNELPDSHELIESPRLLSRETQQLLDDIEHEEYP
jgi:hypothetical protein